jgi:hypothetical protein
MRATLAMLVGCGLAFSTASALAVIPGAPQEIAAKITDSVPKKPVGIVTTPWVDRHFVKTAPTVDPKISRIVTDGFGPRAPAITPPALEDPTTPGLPGLNMPAVPKLNPFPAP